MLPGMTDFAYTNIGTLFRLGQAEEAENRIFQAFVEADFSVAAVASALDVKRSTVESWLNRRKALRIRIREAQVEKARRDLDTQRAT